jgi:peptidoglycan-N-acetylglucosamine deacetylase
MHAPAPAPDDAGISASAFGPGLHRVPRHAYAWLWPLLGSQALLALLWWRFGWPLPVGLTLMAASHAPFWWGVFKPQSQLYGPALSRLPTRERVVWLTIDDGPSDDTLAILDALDAHAAKATFFLVGERAARRPELVREILRRGHDIGNHSHSHPARWFWALGPARMRREIGEAQRALATIMQDSSLQDSSLRASGASAPRWFRAVVGMSNPFVAAALKAHGLARVAWSARGFDGVDGDADAVIARIERDLAPGAIVLLHEGAAHGGNVVQLQRLLARLEALGYRTVLPKA